MTVSIIIVAWNGRQELERCLGSLQTFTSTALELIVVDNASSDGTAEVLAHSYPDVRLLVNTENRGFARACNQGMVAARGDLMLLLNSDTYVEDDVIGRAARHLVSQPDIGMLGCELRYPNGRRQHTANRRIGVRRSLVERLWLYRLLPHSRRAEYLLGGYWEEDRDIEVDWLAGAFMMLRPDLFAQSGGFDERFFMYGEDSEWCMRLRRMGYTILYAPSVGTVFHVGAASSDLAWTEKERLRRCYQGGIECYAALNGRQRATVFRLVELMGVTVRWAVYRVAGRLRPSAYLSSQADFFGWLMRFYAGAR